MNKHIGFTACLLAALAWLQTAHAARYFVSPDGSDRNPGVIDRPFRTITFAVSGMRAGDTLYVRGGDYREKYPDQEYGSIDGVKGTRASPIVISRYQQEKPIISKLAITDSEWLVLDGMTIVGYQPLLENWRDLPEVIVDDAGVGPIDPREAWDTREPKIRKKYATYMELKSAFEKYRHSGVFLKNAHNCMLINNEISSVWAGINIQGGSSHNRIQNNRIHHTVDGVFTWAADDSVSAENNLVSGNHFSQNIYSAVRLLKQARGNIIEDNLSEYNGVGHMDTYAGGAGNVFRNNTLRYAGYYAETMRHPGPSGISIHSAGPGNVVERNFIAYQADVTGNDGGGVIADYTDSQTIIRNNVLYRNMGHGFISTHSSKSVVVHNLFIENGYGSDMPKFGIHMSRKDDVDNVIANNIFYRNKTGAMSFGGIISRQRYVDHNLFHQPGTLLVADDYYDKATRYRDLRSYRRATGFGGNSIDSDPLFVDADEGDFHLTKDSPAIDAATPLHSAADDRDGTARPAGGGADIGAYEYAPD